MAAMSDLPYLIKLLDDQDPAVAPAVSEKLAEFGGDISHDLAALGLAINDREKARVSKALAAGRRETLRDEWIVPSSGAVAMSDDWESFENVMRQISDFLHDGVTLRASLSDSLDLLVSEIEQELGEGLDSDDDEKLDAPSASLAPLANDLRTWLFVSGRFKGVVKGGDGERYFDLCRVIEAREGNATSLGILYMLVAYRMGVQVDGCNYPGHFLNKISIQGEPYLVDGFHKGRLFHVASLLSSNPDMSAKAKAAALGDNHLGIVLMRYLVEMQSTYRALGEAENLQLFTELSETLHV